MPAEQKRYGHLHVEHLEHLVVRGQWISRDASRRKRAVKCVKLVNGAHSGPLRHWSRWPPPPPHIGRWPIHKLADGGDQSDQTARTDLTGSLGSTTPKIAKNVL